MLKRSYVFYTFVSDDYYEPVGTPGLINSFKLFHPDIPLVIFRQDVIDQIIDPTRKFMGGAVNWLNAKPVFARLLTKKFECVVNIDADTIITGRLDEVFTDDYDIGSVMNLNDFENRSLDNITEEMYLQAGLVASRKPEFWDIWMQESLKNNWKYRCAENDSLNVVVYNQLVPDGWKLKVFDKDKDYYGCKSLNREKEMYLQGETLMLRGEKVKAYHAAKGPGNMPKFQWEKMGFIPEVAGYLNLLAKYGRSVIYDVF
jgi:hypothetical protein